MSATVGPAARSSAAGEPRRPGVLRRSARRAWYYLPAIVVFAGVIVAWEVIVSSLALKAFILPVPSAIIAALVDNWSGDRYPLAAAARATLIEALGGLVIGTVTGVAVAFLTARFLAARDILMPTAVAASAIPIIAFAPLMNNWFGLLNPLSKMMMSAILVFFPVMVNVTRGLVQVEPEAVELMRSYAATDWTIMRKVRVPNALPYFFTALKIGTTLSLIGAIVGEYFGGSSSVLGRVIVQSASALSFDITWAAIVLGAATGIAFYLAVVAIERLVIPWHASVRSDV